MTDEPRKQTPTERPPTPTQHIAQLAHTLAERRSASAAYVNVKVSAAGAIQPEVNVTPDTTQEDINRMTALAIGSVAAIMDTAKDHNDSAVEKDNVRKRTAAAVKP